MARQPGASRPPRTLRTDAPFMYFLAACTAALVLGTPFVAWATMIPFDPRGAISGVVLVLLMLGAAYALLSVATQDIVVHPDRLEVGQWLFKERRPVFFIALDSINQSTFGPIDLLSIKPLGANRPVWLLDLFRREDVLLLLGMLEQRDPAPRDDPDILRRAQELRSIQRPPPGDWPRRR